MEIDYGEDDIYDIFVSHNVDVNATDSFLDYLPKQFVKKDLKSYMDCMKAESDVICGAAEKAIACSRLDLIIFNMDYAKSIKCLRELCLMLKKSGNIIMPVYLGVKSEDVRWQKGSFCEAFQDHQLKEQATETEIEEWRCAMFEVSNHQGIALNKEQSSGLEVAQTIATHARELLLQRMKELMVILKRFGLEDLPEEAFYQITNLSLEDCGHLMELPESIRLLSKLEVMNLKGCNKLKALPNSIGTLICLEQVTLSLCSSLEKLPTSLFQLKNLKQLLLFGCFSLESLDDTLAEMECLEYLDISWCPNLQPLSSSMFTGMGVLTELQSLKKLEIDLDKLPPSVGKLQTLRELIILGHFSRQSSMPQGIGSLKNLETLCIYKSSTLQNLPETLGALECLKTLRIWACSSLKNLPNSVCNLKSLALLQVSSGTQLETLPPNFQKLNKSLLCLALDISNMKVFPKVLSEMSFILGLYISSVYKPLPGMRSKSRLSLWMAKRLLYYTIKRKCGQNSSTVRIHLRTPDGDTCEEDFKQELALVQYLIDLHEGSAARFQFFCVFEHQSTATIAAVRSINVIPIIPRQLGIVNWTD